jgi:hypothetical protein
LPQAANLTWLAAFLFGRESTMDGLVLPKVIPKGVSMIRVEIGQIAEPINGTGIEKVLISLSSIVGVWAANAVTNISILMPTFSARVSSPNCR